MIPGFEQTGGCHNGQQVHVNFINVREVFPYISAETPKEILEQTFAEGPGDVRRAGLSLHGEPSALALL